MTPEQEKKLYKRVAVVAFVLGMLCPMLPPEYQVACRFLANVCNGGF